MRPNRPTNPSGRQNRSSHNNRQQQSGAAGAHGSDGHDHGSEVRIRGNLNQIIAKYETLAREAGIAGDPIAVQNYLQHAEHYIRLTKARNAPATQTRDNVEQPNAAEQPEFDLVSGG